MNKNIEVVSLPTFFDVVIGAISDYRCGADARGAFSSRRGVL
jgi:hypothetical protein